MQDLFDGNIKIEYISISIFTFLYKDINDKIELTIKIKNFLKMCIYDVFSPILQQLIHMKDMFYLCALFHNSYKRTLETESHSVEIGYLQIEYWKEI